jgi:5'-deoxynucleotidase YfbR-like HD superfamily hydrolase
MNFEAIRRGGGVRRYHCYRVIAEDTVASHSWGVATIVDKLYGGNPPVHLLRAALYHDIAEYEVGDIPSPAKQALPEEGRKMLADWERAYEHSIGVHIDNLSEAESKVLKFADCYDGYTYCQEEAFRGNGMMLEVAQTYRRYLKGLKEFFVTDGVIELSPSLCDNAIKLLEGIV